MSNTKKKGKKPVRIEVPESMHQTMLEKKLFKDVSMAAQIDVAVKRIIYKYKELT